MNVNLLIDAGINYDNGLKRFANKAPMYEKYLLKFPEEPCFSELVKAMEEKDFDKAFTSAHALKGVVGNLSLDSLYKIVYDFVECLRNHSDISRAIEIFPEVIAEYERMVKAINLAQD